MNLKVIYESIIIYISKRLLEALIDSNLLLVSSRAWRTTEKRLKLIKKEVYINGKWKKTQTKKEGGGCISIIPGRKIKTYRDKVHHKAVKFKGKWL